jgi:hypothetical protein
LIGVDFNDVTTLKVQESIATYRTAHHAFCHCTDDVTTLKVQWSIATYRTAHHAFYPPPRYDVDIPQRRRFGMSFTTFAYSALKVTESGSASTTTFTVHNTGSVAGAEIAQLYVGFPPSAGTVLVLGQEIVLEDSK